jgi:hypothetical protein
MKSSAYKLAMSLAGAVVVSLLVWLGLSEWHSADRVETRIDRTEDSVASVSERRATVSADDSEYGRAKVAAGGTLFRGVRSLTDLDKALAMAPVSEGQKLAYLRRSAEFCGEVEFQKNRDALRQVQEQVTSEKLASLKYVRAYAEGFCNRSLPPGNELYDEIQNIPSDDEVMIAAALGMLYQEGDAALARKQAEGMLLHSRMPDALFYAAINRFGDARGVNTGWGNIDRLPRPASVNANDLFQARLLAVKRLQCALSGGCGPNEFFSVVACNIHANCRPGITAEQAWQGAYSPALLAYSNAVYQELVRLRSAAANGMSDP